MSTEPQAPNHHAGYPGFSGLTGVIAALSMLVGGSRDAELAIRLSGAGAADSVVDIGCGPGNAARRAATRCATVIGVDPARVMLRVARLVTSRRVAVRWVQGTAEALDLPDHAATVAWSLAAVHHWADLGAGLSEVSRIMRPGGRFVAIERLTSSGARGHASHGWTGIQADAFGAACADHGFIDVRVGRHQDSRRRVLSVSAVRG